MNKQWGLKSTKILVYFLLILVSSILVYAVLPSPMIFNGIVKIDGINAPNGTIIEAYMQNDSGVLEKRNNTTVVNGQYFLNFTGKQYDHN